VADKLGNSPSGRDFSKNNGNQYEDDHNERGWLPSFALNLYCAADHQAPFP